VLLGEPGGTKQRVRALLVASAGRVNQRRAEGEPGLRLELVRAARLRLGRRAGERAHTRVEAARVDRGAPRQEARAGGLLPGGSSSRDGRRRPRLRGAKEGGTGIPAELSPKQLHAGRDLPIRRVAITGLGIAADEQLLEVLVVRVQLREPRRNCDGGGRLPRRQAVERSFVEGRLGRTKETAALTEQPRLEAGRVAELHPLEQLAAETGDRDRLLWRSTYQSVDIHKRARAQRELCGAVGQRGGAECRTQLCHVPAQRTERIVGSREEQLSEMLARGLANSAQYEVGDQPPGLAATRSRHGLAVALEVRSAEQMDGERHRGQGRS
jgi:hypothetical protein